MNLINLNYFLLGVSATFSTYRGNLKLRKFQEKSTKDYLNWSEKLFNELI